jgi:hypothetical protein
MHFFALGGGHPPIFGKPQIPEFARRARARTFAHVCKLSFFHLSEKILCEKILKKSFLFNKLLVGMIQKIN